MVRFIQILWCALHSTFTRCYRGNLNMCVFRYNYLWWAAEIGVSVLSFPDARACPSEDKAVLRPLREKTLSWLGRARAKNLD